MGNWMFVYSEIGAAASPRSLPAGAAQCAGIGPEHKQTIPGFSFLDNCPGTCWSPRGGETDQWWGQIGQRNTQKETAAGCMVAPCCNTAGGVQVGLQIIRISPKHHKWEGLRVKLERCCPTVTCCGLHLVGCVALNVSLQRLSCSILINRKQTRGSSSFASGSLFVSSLHTPAVIGINVKLVVKHFTSVVT